MDEKREFQILNRNGLKLVIAVESPNEVKADRLVVIEHGFKGNKDQPHIRAAAEAFLENGFRVVSFDTTNALGKSDGKVFDATYHTYIHDLEDVIEWIKDQAWYSEPFALCGHSMGAQAVAWYAQHHPKNVSLLAPLAPTINYELHSKAVGSRDEELMRTGEAVVPSRSTGKLIRISSDTKESLREYDILQRVDLLTMPILNIVGAEDIPCPVQNQQIFHDALPGSHKTLRIIPNAEHSYRNAKTNGVGKETVAMKHTISEWLREVVSRM